MDLLVNIDVPDLAQAVDFYTRTFGLVVSRRLGPEVAELSGAR
jgi:catechol 2,3-dioxygenase-like lactoylglutathione lyase family enzyme